MMNILRILPRNLISYLFGVLVSAKIPFIAPLIRNVFLNMFDLNEDEAENPLRSYPTLQQMFVRKLKEGARPLDESDFVVPVDGRASQGGVFSSTDAKLVQAKGKDYSLESLLQDSVLAKDFAGGSWQTIYLAPFNYHRIHSPVESVITKAWHIPGTLWPVNNWSVDNIENLFCVNERVISQLETSDGCKLLMVKVGATNVGKITLSYSDALVSNASVFRSNDIKYFTPETPIPVAKGGELGCFELGSTVVLVADKAWTEKHPNWHQSNLGEPVVLGQGF